MVVRPSQVFDKVPTQGYEQAGIRTKDSTKLSGTLRVGFPVSCDPYRNGGACNVVGSTFCNNTHMASLCQIKRAHVSAEIRFMLFSPDEHKNQCRFFTSEVVITICVVDRSVLYCNHVYDQHDIRSIGRFLRPVVASDQSTAPFLLVRLS